MRYCVVMGKIYDHLQNAPDSGKTSLLSSLSDYKTGGISKK